MFKNLKPSYPYIIGCLLLFLVVWMNSVDAARPFSKQDPVITDKHTAVLTLNIALPLFDPQYQELAIVAPVLKAIWSDMAKADENYQFKFFYMTAKQAEKALLAGEVDVVAFSYVRPNLENKFLYSLPFLSLKPAVWRSQQKPDFKSQLKILIDGPQYTPDAPTILNTQSFQAYQSQERPLNDIRFDYIYSLAPATLKTELKRLDLDHLYQALDGGAPNLMARAMYRTYDTHLALLVNQQLQNYDRSQIDELTKAVIGEQETVSLAIGDYLDNLSDVQNVYQLHNPVIRYGFVNDNFGPFHYLDEISPQGFTQDLMEKLSAKTGFEFQPRNYGIFQGVLDGFKSNDIDVMVNMPIGGSDSLSTQAYLQSPLSIASRDKNPISSFEQLGYGTLAMVKGHSFNQQFEAQSAFSKKIMFNSVPEALLAVADGRADAIISNGGNLGFVINDLNLSVLSLQNIRDFDYQSEFRFQVQLEQTDLYSLLDMSINSLSKRELSSLSDKWFNSSDVTKERIEQSLFSWAQLLVSFVIIVLTCIAFAWHIRRRRVAYQETEKRLQEAEKLRNEAQRLGRAKSDFLARMSHEIRTPMNGVLGMAEALAYTGLDQEQKDLLSSLNGSAQNLLALLNDVLDFSKMDAGKLSLERIGFSLESILQQVVGNFRFQARSKGLALNLNIDGKLSQRYLGDPVRITQVLNNIVSNAIKFTPQGQVDIRVLLLDKTDSETLVQMHHLLIEVEDTGIGISDQSKSLLFTPFSQAQGDITRKFGGSGLGLSICKEIVEIMGGTIALESMQGYGSIFSVALNLELDQTAISTSVENHQLDASDLSSMGDLGQFRVLLAEDNPVNVKVIAGQLKRLNIIPDIAVNGRLALDLYQQHEYQIILSDCHMPEMDGFELAKTVNQSRNPRQLRIIAITADALSGAAQQCLDAGFDAYLSKPCTMDSLERKLREQLALLEERSVQNEAAITPLKPLDFDPLADLEQQIYDLALEPKAGLDLEPLTLRTTVQASNVDSLEPEVFSDKPSAVPLSGIQYQFFDPELLLEHSGGDQEVVEEILNLFLQSWVQSSFNIEKHWANLSLESLRQEIHKMKGALGYLGATDISALGQRIETSISNDKTSNMDRDISTFIEQLNLTQVEVQYYLDQTSKAAS